MKKEEFEKIVLSPNIVEELGSKSKKEIRELFGEEVAKMVDYDQNNPHHCYDLWHHTLHVVEGIEKEGLTDGDYKNLKIAAFFHDIGKPSTAKFRKNKGFTSFFNHAQKSETISRPILEKMGYPEKQLNRIEFYIAHHDDFISYKKRINKSERNHPFIREASTETVAEKLFENAYDFKNMGYSPEEIRAICSELASGKKPNFNLRKPLNCSYPEALSKLRSGEYNKAFVPSERDYQLLFRLCKADANAQAKEVYQKDENGNNVLVTTREEKNKNLSSCLAFLPEAEKLFEKRKPVKQEIKICELIQLLGHVKTNRLEFNQKFTDSAIASFKNTISSDIKKQIEESPDMLLLLGGLKNKALVHEKKALASGNTVSVTNDLEFIEDIDFIFDLIGKENPAKSSLNITDDHYNMIKLMAAIKGSRGEYGAPYNLENVSKEILSMSPKSQKQLKMLAAKTSEGIKGKIDLIILDNIINSSAKAKDDPDAR